MSSKKGKKKFDNISDSLNRALKSGNVETPVIETEATSPSTPKTEKVDRGTQKLREHADALKRKISADQRKEDEEKRMMMKAMNFRSSTNRKTFLIDDKTYTKEERRYLLRDMEKKYRELQQNYETMLNENLRLKNAMRSKQERYLAKEQEYKDRIEKLEGKLRDTVTARSTTNERLNELRDMNGAIQERIEHLQGRTREKLLQQEKELERTFQAKFILLQKELTAEREKREIGADEWKERFKKLSDELSIQHDRAVRLDNINAKLEEENKQLKVQFKAQEDDRMIMARQLAISKRDNKRLKEEVEHLEQRVSKLTSEVLRLGGTEGAEDGVAEGDKVCSPAPAGATTERGFGEREKKYVDTIKRLRKLLEQERKNTKTIRTSHINVLAERTELEKFLRQCIDDVREEIAQRKVQNRKQTPRSRTADGSATGEFTTVDRQKVIELLLSKERVLTLLYERTFPYHTQVAAVDKDIAHDHMLEQMESEVQEDGKDVDVEKLWNKWKDWGEGEGEDIRNAAAQRPGSSGELTLSDVQNFTVNSPK